MYPHIPIESAVSRFVTQLRLAGYDFDAIALALAAGSVDALVSSGVRQSTLSQGVLSLVEAMWAHAEVLRGQHEPRHCEPARPGMTMALVIERRS